MADIFGSLAPSLSDPEYWRRLGGIIGNTADPFGSQPFGMTGYGGGRAPLKPAKRSPIDPTQTGWTFKDYKPVHSEMGKGDWARANQDNAVEVELPIRSLFASQKTVNPDFASVPDRDVYKGGDKTHPFVIKKNGQFFVQDGHHRLTAAAQSGKQTAKVRMVDLDGTTQTDFPLLDQAPKPVFGSLAPKPVPTPGIRAYHGSPHDFAPEPGAPHGRFRWDSSTIGTGEGAQAYGHGLYFAQQEDVARRYKENLSNKDAFTGYSTAQLNAKRVIDRVGGDPEFAAEVLKDQINALGPGFQADQMRATLDIIQSGKWKEPLPNPGKMYEVNINANEDDFLDWDKPLSEQGQKVRDVLAQEPYASAMDAKRKYREEMLKGRASSPYYDGPGPDEFGRLSEPKGQEVYEIPVQRLTSDSDAQFSRETPARMLQERGIPGIKFLDAGSRDGGSGSRNFVIFDPAIINIVKKYGIGAALAAGFITQEQADDIEAQRGSGRI